MQVLILRPPRTMDEYLHMAGRTGRRQAGSSSTNSGTGMRLIDSINAVLNLFVFALVISIVNLEEMKRLRSWQTPLGIGFDVKYV